MKSFGEESQSTLCSEEWGDAVNFSENFWRKKKKGEVLFCFLLRGIRPSSKIFGHSIDAIFKRTTSTSWLLCASHTNPKFCGQNRLKSSTWYQEWHGTQDEREYTKHVGSAAPGGVHHTPES